MGMPPSRLFINPSKSPWAYSDANRSIMGVFMSPGMTALILEMTGSQSVQFRCPIHDEHELNLPHSPDPFTRILHRRAFGEVDKRSFRGGIANVHLSNVPDTSDRAEDGDYS